MLHPSSSRSGLAVAALIALVAAPTTRAGAQSAYPTSRGELTPFAGYQWGGTLNTDSFGTIPSGELHEQSAFSWGVLLSYNTNWDSAFEIFYLRQSADVQFNPDREESRDVGTLANNYIQFGGRRDINTGGRITPFISGTLGVNILDASDTGSEWRFAFSLGGGTRIKLPNPRLGLRVDVRWLATPVPSGDYATWCDAWGCYATGGTAWLHQGQASGGLSIAF